MIDPKNPMINELLDKYVKLEDGLLKKEDSRLLLGYYYGLNALCNIIDHGEQPKHISEGEGDFIKSLSNWMTLSQIALVVDRSKSTIHEFLEKAKLEAEKKAATAPVITA